VAEGGRARVALTIAGSDSGGGAGIQADLRTFAALGVHGMSAITALTAQNTTGVFGVVEMAPEFVAQQIDVVVGDIGVDAAKTGMLSSQAIIEVVADRVKALRLSPLVVDPVMMAKGGDLLLRPDAIEAVRRILLPLATLATPNLPEAEALAGFPVHSLADMREAARAIHALGAAAVVVKGGHLSEGDAVDVLFDGMQLSELRSPRYDTPHTHGTGCTFASAIAAGLARELELAPAVQQAKELISAAVRYGLPLGAGHGPANSMALLYERAGVVMEQ
jgi:hydroxymethylpyrimidine/phosphomethylpyrimidine kinase